MAVKVAKSEVNVADHEVYDVTPNMIDWWWVNMEKGYMLWSPDHKMFEWEVPPTNTPVGAIQRHIQHSEPLMRTRYEDPNSVPQEIKDWIIYEHVLIIGGLDPDNTVHFYGIHQYEAASFGTRIRSTGHPQGIMPALPEEIKKHQAAEMAAWTEFLPGLYKMWQVVKDPAINRQCYCRVKKEGSTIRYVK
jgi:hypothetical protein